MSHRDTGYGMSLGIFVRTACNRNILSVYLIGAWEHVCQVFSQGLMAGIGINLITLPILLYYFFRASTAGREACDRKTWYVADHGILWNAVLMVCAIPVDSGNYNSNDSFWRVGETMKAGSCCSHRTLRPVRKRSARKNWLRQARNFSIKIQY